jgi:trehalose synthase
VAGPLAEYETIVGRGAVEELRVVAERVRHRTVQHIHSPALDDGVGETLTRTVPLLQALGVAVTWDVIKGNEPFLHASKAIADALRGRPAVVGPAVWDAYRANTELNLRETEITGDVVFVHDPPPAGLVLRKEESRRSWVWRCHGDLSAADPETWEFLRAYVERYDAAIVSMPGFAKPLPFAQYLFAPAIDPLSERNRDLPPGYVAKVLAEHGLDPARPILAQIARFDRIADPTDLLGAYRLVKRRFDCQLVLAGDGTADEPEGRAVLRELREAAAGDPDIHVIHLTPFSDLEVNALVRGSAVVLQLSIRDGFGLGASEALWKRRPVVGDATGGLKLQVVNGVTGYLVHSCEGAAHRTMALLADPGLRERMGENGYRHVLQNFLVTRQVKDYMLVLLALEHPGEDIVHLG